MVKAKYILWDFDRTLIPIETESGMVFDTIKYFWKKGKYLIAINKFLQALHMAAAYGFGKENTVKRIAADVYSGLTLNDIKRFSKKYAKKIPKENIEKLKEAKKKKYKNYILSCGYTQTIEEILKSSGMRKYVDKVYANTFVTKNSRIIGSDFKFINSKKKLENAKKLKIDFSKAIAVGDGRHEIALFKLVGRPIVVAGKSSMERLARENNWEIVNSLSEVKL